ncbi:MAG: hypothetical protein GX750_05255 [Clostridia bacterium]|nr:hypothetical protein [Clostridia bacterium]
MTINLLPEELTSAGRQRASKKSGLYLLLICYCCISVILYSLLSMRINALGDQRKAWEGLLSEREALQLQLETLEQKINSAYEEHTALETALNTGLLLTETLTVLQHHLPHQLRVKQIIFSGEGWVIVYGEAETMESISLLAASLSSDSFFPEVKLGELYLDPEKDTHHFTLQLLTDPGKVGSNEV